MDIDAELENTPYNATTETDDEGTEALTGNDEVYTIQPNGKKTKIKKTFIRSNEGILMVINTVFICLSWMIMAGWKNAVTQFARDEIDSHAFFLVVAIVSSIINVLILVILVIRINETKLSMVNWKLTLMLTSGIEAFLILITSAISLSEVSNATMQCEHLKCTTLRAAGAFGVLSVFGLAAQCTIHVLRHLKSNNSDNEKK